MKKNVITRKSLEELSRTMPVLSEDEQRMCVGGTAFYDASGNFLGDFGAGDDIRVISPGELAHEKSRAFEDLGFDYKSCATWGKPVKEAGMKNEEITKLLSHVVGQDIGSVFSENISYCSGTGFDARTLRYDYGVGPDIITLFALEVDLGSQSMQKISYFRSTYYHETVHRNNTGGDDWTRENVAYTAQTSQDGFKSLDESYRLHIKRAWIDEYYTKMKPSGAIPEDVERFIYSQCGFSYPG